MRRRQAEQRSLQHHKCRLRGGLALPGQDVPQRHSVDELITIAAPSGDSTYS